MDIASDVRYSVLKEKSSNSDLNWTTTDDSYDDSSNISKSNLNSATTKTSTNTIKDNSIKKDNNNNNNSKKMMKSVDRQLKLRDSDELELSFSRNQKNLDSNLSNTNSNSNTNNNNNLSDLNKICLNNIDSNNILQSKDFNDMALDLEQNITINQPSNINEIKIFFKKRTRLEKILILIVLILTVFIIFNSYLLLNKTSSSSNNDLKHLSKYCMSDQCILVSGAIYKSLNTKVDPCDDFYEFSCGGWLKRNLIPNGFPRWGTLSSITYRNQLIIKELLESNSTDHELTEAEMKAKIFYKSCIDSNEKIEKLGSKPLTDILDGFIYKNSDSKLVINQTFTELLSLIQIKYGLNALFEFNVLDDDKNSSFSNIEALEVYKRTIINVIGLLYGTVNNVTVEVENVIELETSLAKIMLPNEKLTNVENVYSRVNMLELNEKHARFFDWKSFINKILKYYSSPHQLNDDDKIIVMGLEYFQNLNNLINEYQTTPKKEFTLKFFVVSHLIRFALPLLSKEYRAQFTALGEALTGTSSVERWQTCIEHTDNIFGLGYAITKMFIRKTPNNSKNAAQKIIKSIKDSFIKNFPNTPWMDNETRILAEEKVNSVDELIGYPDFIENNSALNLRYKDLNISEEDYFGNEIRLVQYALKFEISTYRTRVNRAEWEMTSSAVNAYYSPTRNQIVFPSGILQEPFFHPNYPMSLNYGSIGSIMGHELTHGFDNSGREYDKNGMMHQWWNNKTIENFEKASECIVEQYSKYKVEDDFVDGKQTLGENIADNGGLRSAFNAYEEWVRENGEEKPLPVLNLTHRQLLFVSFAQTWCTKSTPDSMHLSISIDQHSPPRFRVIGSLSNSVEFAKAFNCPAETKMNPSRKCVLW